MQRPFPTKWTWKQTQRSWYERGFAGGALVPSFLSGIHRISTLGFHKCLNILLINCLFCLKHFEYIFWWADTPNLNSFNEYTSTCVWGSGQSTRDSIWMRLGSALKELRALGRKLTLTNNYDMGRKRKAIRDVWSKLFGGLKEDWDF